jgi:hypothetical protein
MYSKRIWVFPIILLGVLLFAAPLFSQEDNRIVVGIEQFTVSGTSEDNGRAITAMFGAELAKYRKEVRVVDHYQIDKIKKQHEFENSVWSSSNKKAVIGEGLNADCFISGTLMALGKSYTISISLNDVNTMELLFSSQGQVNKLEQAGGVVAKLTADIFKELKANY